jgi:tetratricopeptide (TPR) repeat protein
MIGQTLGHYRIIEKIGGGGMGVVYLSHDEQLDRDVALKILTAGLLTDEMARNRFRKEALALAKLNHPNIETVYEFGSADGVDFLAMELIHGETVGARLIRASFPNEETIRLGLQLAEGLAAAHAQGLVHRDLKPGNLMLTPEGRLKILDFGLARLVQPDTEYEASQTISETSPISGTLPYMSPEQLKGLQVDARSDLFAAGAVLYEMVTGQKPFPQKQSAELIGAILHREPLPVRSLNPRAAPNLAAAIHKCLEKDPQNRYQSARELLAALEGMSSGKTMAGAKHRGLLGVAAGSILLLILTAGIVLGLNVHGMRDRLFHRSNPGTPVGAGHVGPIKARPSVAVLGFKNLSGRNDEDWLSTALSDMLTTELAAGEKLRTVSEESVARMKIDLALADSDTFAPDTLVHIRRNLSTDYVVVGSYLALGEKSNGQVRLDLHLQDASAGETIASVSETGTEQALPELISRAGLHLREKLGVAPSSTAEPSPAPASSLPVNREAARLYAEGVTKMRAFDALGARELLQKAVSIDPNSPLAHSALASALSALGYDEKAKEEAKKALNLSGSLSREQRLSIEAAYCVVVKDRSKAEQIYRSLWDFFPDNLDYGYSLAMAQTSAGHPREALATLEDLRQLPPPENEDPRIDQAELEAAAKLGDYKRMQAAAAKAAGKGTAMGARRLVAFARVRECYAFLQLGQPARANASCEEGKELYSNVGDRMGLAWALNNIATLRKAQGDTGNARKGFEEALALYRQIGKRDGTISVLNNLGTLLDEEGKFDQAIRLYDQVLAICRETGDQISEAIALTNVGNARSNLGDLVGAKKAYGEADTLYREIGNKSIQALNLSNLASILCLLGDLDAAKTALAQAHTLMLETNNKSDLVYVLSTQGDVAMAEANLPAARQKYEQAISSATELGNKVPAAENQVLLGQLSIAEGRPGDASTSLWQTLEIFRSAGATDDEVAARTVLAESLLVQNKLAEAWKQIDAAKRSAEKSQSPAVRVQYEIVSARIRAAKGNDAEAEKSLEATLTEATKHGLVNYQFQSRLALAEIEMKSGRSSVAVTSLDALSRDASARGFLLIAQKAQVAATKTHQDR